MRLTAVIRPNQPTRNVSFGIPSRRRTSDGSPSNRTRGSRSIPSRITSNFDAGATPSPTSSSRTSGLTATSRSLMIARIRSIARNMREPTRAEVPAQDVSVERVDDDRPRSSREERREPSDRAGLRRVRVDDVRADVAQDPREPERRDEVVHRGQLAGEPGQADDLDARAVRDPLHRLLAARHVAGDERRLVAARGEPLGQVRDVERRAADVEAGDHADDPHGSGIGRRRHARERSRRATASNKLSLARWAPSTLARCSP